MFNKLYYNIKLAFFVANRSFPGDSILGSYKFVPVYFFIGAMAELWLIKFKVGDISFYDVYQKSRARKEVQLMKNSNPIQFDRYRF
ncbi:hypothetical protein GJ496_000020 [Pomphorhynchus laevis]|nr:hypothetical protein GJ496_000020 [Pomphorhynchus laevis]